MISTRKELEWFLTGVLIAGGKEKFNTQGEQVENSSDSTVDTSDTTEQALNIRL